MRVIAGCCRGMRLNDPGGLELRPTIDRVKEGIFSSIQFMIRGKNVLDLFGGTGQLGLEALSRGANKCTFVDIKEGAHTLQIENLKETGLFERAKVICQDSMDFLSNCTEKFDIVFLDPPFKSNYIDLALNGLKGKLKIGGIIVCEHQIDYDLEAVKYGFKLQKTLKYGKIKVTILKV